jgi:hypothetical protein
MRGAITAQGFEKVHILWEPVSVRDLARDAFLRYCNVVRSQSLLIHELS